MVPSTILPLLPGIIANVRSVFLCLPFFFFCTQQKQTWSTMDIMRLGQGNESI